MKASMSRRAGAVALATIVVALAGATLISGCSNKGCTRPGEVEDPYPPRTSPANVIEKLNLAYENMDLEAYIDCLAEDFVFVLNPHDPQSPDLPVSWDKEEEESIHSAMFGDVEQISLVMTPISQEEVLPPDPGDPPTYERLEGIDLRVTVPGDLTLLADNNHLFLLEVDPDRVSASGETLWVIFEWQDLPPFDRSSHGDSSWSTIKALYR